MRGGAFLMLLAVGLAQANPLPLSAPINGTYLTISDAEKVILPALVACGSQVECGTAVYEDRAGYHVTTVVTQRRQAAVDYRVAVPRGACLVELLHTHPTFPGSVPLELSSSDKALSKTLHVPVVAYAVAAKQFVGEPPDDGLTTVTVPAKTVSAAAAESRNQTAVYYARYNKWRDAALH